MYATRRETSSITLVCTPPSSDTESLSDRLVLPPEAARSSIRRPTPPSVTLSCLPAHHRMICALTSLRADYVMLSVPWQGNL
jgi:hypothetical protein